MVHSLQIPCSKIYLKKIRRFVETILSRYGISGDNINLVVVAIDEICANLIIHAHQCNANDHIEIRIIRDDANELFFEVHDPRPDDFDITKHPVPDILQIVEEHKSGGIGLILVRKIMDDIQLERHAGRCICRMKRSNIIAGA